jgi:hypothetical protein
MLVKEILQMAQRENEKMFGFYAQPSLMKQFQATATAQDLNMSQLMRRLARWEIKRYAREVASEK